MAVDDPLVLYVQLTLGAPHLARIRALDRQPGIRCRGVQLASDERTRRTRPPEDRALFSTLMEGEYESLSRPAILRAALRHLDETGASAIIVDAPADPVQLLLGRIAHRRGLLACTRWAATWADHPRKGWKEWLKRFVYRGWDAYFVTGERGLEYLRTFDVPSDRSFVCGNPADAEAIASERARTGRIEREHSFLFVGRFLTLKNLERFARAYLRYRSEGGTWRLDIVGFGETEAAVRQLLEAEASVTFHGALGHDVLIPMYLRAGCLVLPSYSENWGLVVNEAMHAGMPIAISSLTGCAPELLREGENGVAFDPWDEASMASALKRIESLDAQALRHMGEASLSIIESHTPDAWAGRVHAGLLAVGLE
jgi:glycosyltransferase involved in cell wall biosynthesis